MKFLTWQNPEQLFVAQDFKKVKNFSAAELRILEIMHVSKSIYHQWDLQLLDMEYRFIPTGVLMELQDV